VISRSEVDDQTDGLRQEAGCPDGSSCLDGELVILETGPLKKG